MLKGKRMLPAPSFTALPTCCPRQLGFEIGAQVNALHHEANIAKAQEWLRHANSAIKCLSRKRGQSERFRPAINDSQHRTRGDG